MSEETGGEACSVLTAMWRSRLLSRSISEILRDEGESCLILAGQQSACLHRGPCLWSTLQSSWNTRFSHLQAFALAGPSAINILAPSHGRANPSHSWGLSRKCLLQKQPCCPCPMLPTSQGILHWPSLILPLLPQCQALF